MIDITINKNIRQKPKRLMRQQAQSFEEKDGTLYHVSDGKASVPCCSEQARLMQACHDGIY